MKSYKTKNMNLQLFAENEITDLTGTSWILNDVLFVSEFNFSLNYSSNNNDFRSIEFLLLPGPIIDLFILQFDGVQVYEDGSGWTEQNYKTINITGGTDANNIILINWLQANATQIQTGYSSTINLTNCTCNKSNETGLSGNYTATVTANSGYYLSSVTSTLGTATISTDKHTATIEISDVNADFTISATGTAKTTQNVILHPDNNGVTDYTTDLLPKAQSDASKQNALTTTSVSDGTISKNIGFDSQGNIVKATPSSGGSSTWGSITGTLSNQTDLYNALSNKQSKITSFNKLSSGLVDDSQSSNKFVTINEKNAWSGKQDAITSSNKLSADNVDDTSTTNKFVTASEKNTWNGKSVVIANPTLAGTESDLTGLEIDGTKYKVTTGGGSAGVSSLGGATGDITLGSGLAISNNELRVVGSGTSCVDLLWTNLNPTSDFAAQTLSVDLTGYSLFGVEYKIEKGYSTAAGLHLFRVGAKNMLYWANIGGGVTYTRRFNNENVTDIVVGNQEVNQSTVENYKLIPLNIYGIK